jgi:hypothetical protein
MKTYEVNYSVLDNDTGDIYVEHGTMAVRTVNRRIAELQAVARIKQSYRDMDINIHIVIHDSYEVET